MAPGRDLSIAWKFITGSAPWALSSSPLFWRFFSRRTRYPRHPSAPAPAHGVIFALHVTLSILGYSAFALASVLSLMYLGEERLLRIRKLGEAVWRLPSLELLERMSHTSVLVGLASITIGTSLGFLAVERHLAEHSSYLDPKYFFTLFVLVLYAVYFRLARTAAWRGARASRLCVFNFVLVI